MRKFFLTLIMLVLLFLIVTAKTITIPGLNRPVSLQVHRDQVFINDGPSILIYSLKDFKLLHRFGKKGEGPEEFKTNPSINRGGVFFAVHGNTIMVCSLGRISFFNLKGKFIRQHNPKTLFGFGQFVHVGRKFVSMGFAATEKEQFITFNFYDQQFRKGKEIFSSDVYCFCAIKSTGWYRYRGFACSVSCSIRLADSYSRRGYIAYLRYPCSKAGVKKGSLYP